MGKFIQGFLAVILLVVLGVLFAQQTGKISFNNSGPGDKEIVSDSLTESTPINILDVSYYRVEDVLVDQQDLITETQYIDAFKEIPTETLENVVNMLLRSRQCIKIKDIVNEYILNQNIYDNIVANAVIDPGAKKENEITNADTTAKKSTNESQDPNPVAAHNGSEEGVQLKALKK